MSSNTCSFSGFPFVFVIVISPKCVDGWLWVVDGLTLGIYLGSADKGGEGSGGGDGGKYCGCWNELNDNGGGSGEGYCGGGTKLLNVGGDGRGKGDPSLLLLNLFLSFRNASNLFCMFKSPPGLGAFLISSLTRSSFPMSSSRSKDPTTGFCASKVEISSNTSLRGFCRQKIFFDIRSSLCL